MQTAFKLNRPFFFVVQDVQTQVVLVLGKINEPKLDTKRDEELRIVRALQKLTLTASKFGKHILTFSKATLFFSDDLCRLSVRR